MFSTLVLSALTVLPNATGDAPLVLITQHGVELRADEQVFVLFAALNAAGYAEESRRKGPPLRAPEYHGIREQVREAMRKLKDPATLDNFQKLVADNPGEVEDYLLAVLTPDAAASKLSGKAKELRPKLLPALERFRTEGELALVFDKLADEQRKHAKELKTKIEASFAETAKALGTNELRAPLSVVVVPNPLDSHESVRLLPLGDQTLVIVGPGMATAEQAILEASLRPVLLGSVKKAYGQGKGFSKSWDGFKTSKRITERWPTGEDYLADALTHALVFRVRAKQENRLSRDTEEEFIDAQAQKGMRWSRAALKVLDAFDGKAPLDEALPKLLAKNGP